MAQVASGSFADVIPRTPNRIWFPRKRSLAELVRLAAFAFSVIAGLSSIAVGLSLFVALIVSAYG